MKETKKKKNSSGQWIAVALFMLIGGACGFLFARCMGKMQGSDISTQQKILSVWLMIVCLVGVLIVEIILHEAGHLLFGLMTGYRFCSFRIFGLMWLKKDGRIQFKRLNIAGTGGQCLMAPPDLKDGKIPVMLYNFGGAIVNLFTAVICLVIFFLCPAGSFARVLTVTSAFVGFAFAIMNGLPVKMGPVNNDGRNALDLAGSETSIRAFWIQMKINELISAGIRLKDMPDEWFTLPDDESMKSGIDSTVAVMACNRLMDQHRFEEAETMMKRLLSMESGMVGLYRNLLTCDRMYVEMITENRTDTVEGMRTREQLKIMKAMKDFPSVLRTEYAYELLSRKDSEKAETVRKRFEKSAKSYPYPSEIEGERELMEIAEEQNA